MEKDPENDDLEGSLLAPCEEPPGEVENLIEDSVYHSPPSGNSQTIVEVIQETGKPSAKVCVSAEQSRPVISSIDENKSLQTGANGSATGTEQEPNATGGKTGLSQTPIEPNEGNKTDVNASDPNGNENLRRPELLLIEEADFSKVTGNVSNLIERDDVSIDIVTNSTQKGVSVPPEVPDSNPSSTQPQNGDSASPPFAKPENDAAIGPTLTTAQKEGLRNPFDSTYNIEQRKSRTSFFTPDLLPPNILNSYRSLSRKERDLFRVVYGYGLSNEAIVDYVELAKKHLQMLKDRKVTSLPVSPVAGGFSVPLQHLHLAFESKYLTSDVAKLYLNFDCHLQAKFRKLFFMGVPEDEIIAIVKDPNVYLDKLKSLRPKSSQRPRPEKNDVSNALGSRREEVTGVPKASSSNQLRAPCNPTKPPELYHSNFNPQRMIPRRFLGTYLKLKKSMKTKFRVLMYNKVPVSKILTTIRNPEDYKSLLETLEASRTVDPTPKLGIKRKKSDDDTISQPKSPTVPTKNNGPPPGYHENFDPPSVLRTRYLNIYLGMSSTQQKRFRTLFYHKMPVYKIINSVGTNSAFKTSLRTQLLQNRNNSTKSDLFDLNKLTDRQASYYINLGKGERKKYRHMFNQGYSHQEIHDGINDQELYFQMFSRQKMPANLERSPSPAESSNHRSFLDTCGKQLPETSTAHSTNVDSAFIETLAKTRYLVNQMKTPLVKSGPFSVQPSAYPQRYQDNFKSQANQPGPSSAVDPPVREIMEPRLFAVPKTKPSHVGNANPIMAMKRHVDSNYPSACLAPPKIPRKTAAPMPTTRELEKMEKSRIVYVSHALHPRELLTIAEMEEVQQRILDFILELDDGLKPSFVHANLNRQSGQLEFHCKDDNTVNWLRSFIPTWKPWTGAHLKAVVASTEGIRYKAFAILPKCMEDGDSKILQYVGKQNTKLNVMKWSVLKTDANPNGTVTMDLLIDEESAQVLSENPQINFKLGGAKIKVLMDDSVNERTLTKGQDWTRKPTRSPLQGVGISGGEISVAAKEPRQPVQFRTPTWDQRRDVVYGDAPPSWYNPKRSDYNDSVSYRKFSPAGPSSNQQLHSSIEPLPSRDSAPLYDQGYGLRQPPSPNVVRDGSLPIHEGVEKPINQSRHFSQHKAGSSQVPKKSFTEKSQSSVFKRLSYQEDLGNNQRFRDDPYPSHSRSERSSDFMGDSQQHFRRSRERSPVPVSNYEERSHMWDSGRSQSPLTRGDSHHCSVWERERSPASSSRRELDKKQSFRDDRYSSHSRSDLERSPDFRGRERSPVRISKYEERRSMWDDEQPPVPRSDPHQQYSKRDRERSPVPKRDFQQRRSERDDEPYIDRRSDNQMLARSVYELPHRDFDELPYSRSSDLYASERSASPRDSFDDPQLTPRWFQERSPEPRAVPQPKSRRDTSQPTEGSADYLDNNFSRNNTERYSRYDDSSKSDVRNSFQPVKRLSGAGQRRLSYFIQCGLPFNIAQTLAKKPINKPPGKSLSPGKLKRMYDMMTSVEQFEYIKCLADGMNIEEAMMKVSRPGRLSSARPSYPH